MTFLGRITFIDTIKYNSHIFIWEFCDESRQKQSDLHFDSNTKYDKILKVTSSQANAGLDAGEK